MNSSYGIFFWKITVFVLFVVAEQVRGLLKYWKFCSISIMGKRKETKTENHQSPIYLKQVSNFKATLRRRDSQRFLRNKVRKCQSAHRKSDKCSCGICGYGSERNFHTSAHGCAWFPASLSFRWPHLSNTGCKVIISLEKKKEPSTSFYLPSFPFRFILFY